MPKFNFAATTPGLSATRWLSYAVATNKDVYVTHGKHNLKSIYLNDIDHEVHKSDYSSITDGNNMAWLYNKLTISEVYKLYADLNLNCKAVGNIHTYTLKDIDEKLSSNNNKINIKIINVLRHPINYINSHNALVQKVLKSESNKFNPSITDGTSIYDHYARDMFGEVLSRFPELMLIECNNLKEFISFAVSCFSVYNLINDINITEKYPINFRMEDLTTNVNVLHEFCEKLTNVNYNIDSLLNIVEKGPINKHKNKNLSNDPVKIFRNWSSWQKDILRLVVPSEVTDMYNRYGYDTSMLNLKKLNIKITEAKKDFKPGISLADNLLLNNSNSKLLNVITN